MMRKYILILVLVFISKTAAGQDVKTQVMNILIAVNKKYSEAKSFSASVTHNFYKSHESQNISETFKGYYYRENNKTHSFLMGIETIQNKDSRVVIDTNNKAVVYQNPVEENNYPAPDLTQTLKLSNQILILDTAGVKRITLNFDRKSYPCSKLEIYVLDDVITKLILFHSEVTEDENDVKMIPKTEIIFSNIKINKKLPESEFTTSNVVQNYGTKATLTHTYEKYVLTNLFIKE